MRDVGSRSQAEMGLGARQEARTHPILVPPLQFGRFLQWQAQGASGLLGRQQGAASTDIGAGETALGGWTSAIWSPMRSGSSSYEHWMHQVLLPQVMMQG